MMETPDTKLFRAMELVAVRYAESGRPVPWLAIAEDPDEEAVTMVAVEMVLHPAILTGPTGELIHWIGSAVNGAQLMARGRRVALLMRGGRALGGSRDPVTDEYIAACLYAELDQRVRWLHGPVHRTDDGIVTLSWDHEGDVEADPFTRRVADTMALALIDTQIVTDDRYPVAGAVASVLAEIMTDASYTRHRTYESLGV